MPKGSFAIGIVNMKDGGYPRKVGANKKNSFDAYIFALILSLKCAHIYVL